ncbi:hypothetical protein [Nocardiopsis listeri]|uniref:hypothetical protein n=1 Tax=Nocardiopsis listeri TaxID=53440 RepID=UPI000833273E|nr:hypothetical protein [Nocardiopsis listeri]
MVGRRWSTRADRVITITALTSAAASRVTVTRISAMIIEVTARPGIRATTRRSRCHGGPLTARSPCRSLPPW